MLNVEFYIMKAKEKGLNQTDLAKLCGCTPQHINQYWKGRSNIGSIMHKKLIKALEIELHYK